MLRKIDGPDLSMISEVPPSETTSSEDGGVKFEGPDLSMISEVPPSETSSSDDGGVKFEGPDLSMILGLSASTDVPRPDLGTASQGDSTISAGLVNLGIDNESSTDDSTSDTDFSMETGGSWIPLWSDYSNLY